MGPLKRIPLDDVHRHEKARMTAFAGWDLPAWYTSILEEHRAVRSSRPIFKLGEEVRRVTSGGYAPTLGFNIGLGYVPAELATIGNDIEIMIRDKLVIVHTVSRKFYKRGERDEPQGI